MGIHSSHRVNGDMAEEEWGHVKKILCIRLDAMGDVLMTSPAIRALKETSPDRHITLLTSPAGAAIGPYIPALHEVVTYEAPWMKATPRRHDSARDRAMISWLRQQRFDAAIIFTVYSQNPLPAAQMCYMADIPLRLAHCRENPYQLLTHWITETEPQTVIRHEVRRQLDMVAAIGSHAQDERMQLVIPRAAHASVREILAGMGVELAKPWILMHPGASAPSRRYRPAGFAQAADILVRDHGCQIVFSGAAYEADLVEAVRQEMREISFSVAGHLDLPSFAAALAQSRVLVSNNSGPVHIAAALGKPVVDLYALTNPQHMPWMVPHRVLYRSVPCRFCYKSVCPQGHHDCLQRIAPEEIVQAVVDLSQTGQSRWPGGCHDTVPCCAAILASALFQSA